MTRTLLLHAGLPKTGTTSIQNALHAARETLLRTDGLLYPGFAANHTNAMCTLFMADPAAHIANRMAGLKAGEAVADLKARFRDALERDLARPDWDRVLISAEGVANLDRAELLALKAWFSHYVDEIDVLYYVREPVAYTTSVAQQALKGGATLAELNRQPPLPNFRGRIGNAIAAFGLDAVRIRDFGAALKVDGGLVADFCIQLDIGAEGTEAVLAQSGFDNEFLSLEGARMLSQLNMMRPLFDAGGRAARRTGKETLAFEKLPGNKFALPLPVRTRVHASTRADVAWLNQNFGLELYGTPPPTAEDHAVDPKKQADASHASILLISDLMNAVDALTASIQARNLSANGDHHQAAQRMRDALRLAPDNALVCAEAARIEERAASASVAPVSERPRPARQRRSTAADPALPAVH